MANLVASAVRLGAYAMWDKIAQPKARTLSDVPFKIDAATPAWLTAALCADEPDTQVVAADFGPTTSGSTVRRRIKLKYNRDVGNRDLPASLFAKSSPSFLNRMQLTAVATIENEALFYRHIRPELTLEAPRGYHCAFDMNSGRSIQLMEDLVATKGATFCSPATYIDRTKAEDVVSVLAALHGRFYGDTALATRYPWLRSYPDWFAAGFDTFNLWKFHDQAIEEASAVIPQDVLARRGEIRLAQNAALARHGKTPNSLLHGDVHLGNWYITDAGRMGLCDWQCMSIGSWARDFAYAVTATLTVEDRRAWDRDLMKIYLAKLASSGGREIPFDEAWTLYRAYTVPALLMWTPTLCHSPWMPDMQPREISMEMVKRMTTAISDLEALNLARAA